MNNEIELEKLNASTSQNEDNEEQNSTAFNSATSNNLPVNSGKNTESYNDQEKFSVTGGQGVEKEEESDENDEETSVNKPLLLTKKTSQPTNLIELANMDNVSSGIEEHTLMQETDIDETYADREPTESGNLVDETNAGLIRENAESRKRRVRDYLGVENISQNDFLRLLKPNKVKLVSLGIFSFILFLVVILPNCIHRIEYNKV